MARPEPHHQSVPHVRPIAVGVDFSEQGAIAIEHAAALAELRHAPLHLLHVAPTLGTALGPPGTLAAESMRRTIAAEVEQGLEAEQRTLHVEHPRLAIEARRIDGQPGDDLANGAVSAGAEFLVVGTHGRTGISRLLMGSVAERTVRNSVLDVLVSRGQDVAPYRRVLVAYDFSDQAQRAIERAIQVVSPDGSIKVLHAVQHALPIPPEGSPMSNVRFFEDAFGAAQRMLADARDGWRKRFDAIEVTCVTGSASSAIRRELDDGDYDLVCIGSHGRTGIKRWLLGSVAETIVRHANCTVLVVKESPADAHHDR